jgi:hypothetical protein
VTQQELDALVAEWQARLRLRDWIVEIEVVRGRDMSREECAGELWVSENLRCATISLRDELDYDESSRPFDPEMVIVHELLHLYTRPFGLPREGPKHIAEEQMIEAVSQALVKAKREGVVHNEDSGETTAAAAANG